jgi:hypothetical protein
MKNELKWLKWFSAALIITFATFGAAAQTDGLCKDGQVMGSGGRCQILGSGGRMAGDSGQIFGSGTRSNGQIIGSATGPTGAAAEDGGLIGSGTATGGADNCGGMIGSGTATGCRNSVESVSFWSWLRSLI